MGKNNILLLFVIIMPCVVGLTVNIDLNEENKTIDFLYGVSESVWVKSWINEFEYPQYKSTPLIKQYHQDIATMERIWIQNGTYYHQIHTIPLMNDCSTYNFDNLTTILYTVLTHNMTPFINLADIPDCINITNYPDGYEKFANYSAETISGIYLDCIDDNEICHQNGSCVYCGEAMFKSWGWTFLNEPHTPYWISNDHNYSILYNYTYRAVNNTVPQSYKGTADGYSAGATESFFNNITEDIYPDFVTSHPYDAWLTINPDTPYYNGSSVEEALGWTHIKYRKISFDPRTLDPSIKIYNTEYGQDARYTYEQPYAQDDIGATWMASVLYNQIIAGYYSGDVLFGATEWQHNWYGSKQDNYYIWNVSNYTYPKYHLRKKWVNTFSNGTDIYQVTNNNHSIEIMSSISDTVIINKLNQSINVASNYSGQNLSMLIRDDNLIISPENNIFNITIDEFGVDFFTHGTQTALHNYLQIASSDYQTNRSVYYNCSDNCYLFNST